MTTRQATRTCPPTSVVATLVGLAAIVLVASCAEQPEPERAPVSDETTTTAPTGPTTTALAPATTSVLSTEWSEGAAMGTARSEMPAVVAEGLVLVPGGFEDTGGPPSSSVTVEIYDPVADTWIAGPDLPARRDHPMAAGYQGAVYLFGGFDSGATSTAWRLDPESDRWEEVASLPVASGAGAAVNIGEHIYVVGGRPAGDNAHRYHPETDTWEELPSMGRARDHLAAVAYEGELWVLGGRWSGEGIFASTEIYDPEAGEWREGPEMPEPRSGFGAAVVEGDVVVGGGELLGDDMRALASVDRLDTATGNWESLPDLPVTLHGVAFATVDDRVIVPGGSTEPGAISNPGRTYLLDLSG